MKSCSILGMRINITSVPEVTKVILTHVLSKKQILSSSYVCVANVHMCMEAYNNREYQQLVNAADLVTPDGRPLVWIQKAHGYAQAQSVRGLELTQSILQMAEKHGIAVGFYGSSEQVLSKLRANLTRTYPRLTLATTISPPYKILSNEEQQAYLDQLNQSGAQIIFVGLGCPKQERWMAVNSSKLHGVLIGVGAVFDFLSGSKQQAPKWLHRLGFEWLFRFCCEPKRLWRRYLVHNSRFILLLLKQLVFKQKSK